MKQFDIGIHLRIDALKILVVMSKLVDEEKPLPDFSDPRRWKLLSFCPLCNDPRFCVKVITRDRHYGNPGSFTFVKCVGCGVYFLNPMPTADYLASAYPTDYYAYNLAAPNSRISLSGKVKKFLRTVLFFHTETKDPAFRQPGRVLDVGCGYGFFLRPMKEKGWEVHGVEPDSAAAERGCREGLDIFTGFIDQAHYPSGYFDYVRSNHSFEHVHNPREALREMRRVIKPSGYLFIGVPNLKGLAARFFGTYWWHLGAPVHTFGYCPESLEKLLASEGFRVEKVNYNSTYSGIFGSLQIYLNRNNGKSSEHGLIVHNPVLMLIGHWTARVLDLLKVGDCIEVIARPQ
jgi:SAM-dependent methyltransferase